MSLHKIDLQQLPEMRCTDVSITSCSRAADSADMTFEAMSKNEESPFLFGDCVELTSNGKTVFFGYVTSPPTFSVSPSGFQHSVKLENIVALMDATPYLAEQSFKDIVDNTQRIVDAEKVVKPLLESGLFAPGGVPAEETISVELPCKIVSPAGSGSQSCWSLVTACLHWVPNAVTWFNPENKELRVGMADVTRTIELDLNEKACFSVENGEREKLFSFQGFDEANFKPRFDLCPPAVGLVYKSLRFAQTFPEGASLRQPWAFCYQMPQIGGADNPEDNPSPYQEVAAQKMIVRGHRVPDGWRINGNMKVAWGAPEVSRKFWAQFSGAKALAKTNSACLAFGLPVFNSTPAVEAYPPDEDGNSISPDNYKEFTEGALYVHYEGSFPASPSGHENVRGLKFCKGVLRQYVWLTTDYVGSMTKAEFEDFFKGTARFDNKKTRYALLELQASFINRGYKTYKTGTNSLDESDIDYSPDEDEGGSGSNESVVADIATVAEDYYNDTRKVFFDGSITLHGVEGYSPSSFFAANMSIIGARDEWRDMATPIVQAQWQPSEKVLSVFTGSPEILTFDERLQRMQLGRQTAALAGTSNASPIGGSGGSGVASSAKEFAMVAPSVSASATVTKSGRPLNPFEIYVDDDGRAYMNEGILYTNEGPVDFPVTDITDDYAIYKRFSVDVEYNSGKPVVVVRKWGKR